MLTEFAITSDVLRQCEKGREQQDLLRELAHGMFPRGSASPVIIANLQGGAWLEEVVKVVSGINSRNAREKAQSFLSQLKKVCVVRPAVGDRPVNEDGWVREAIAQAEPIERVIASREACQDALTGSDRLFPPEAAAKDEFWENVSSVRSVPLDLEKQIDLLRPICLHTNFIAFASPYVFGAEGDETDFAAGLIRSALDRPRGFPKAVIHIHTKSPFDQTSRSNRIFNVVERLKETNPARLQVKLFARDSLLERVLLAGDHVLAPGRDEMGRDVRWGVSITHAARTGDRGSSLSTFSLMDRAARTSWQETLYPSQGDLPEEFEV